MTEVRYLLSFSAYRLEIRESQVESWEDPYSDMNPDEKSKLLIELTRQLSESQQLIQSLLQKIDKLTESQLSATAEIRSLRRQLTD